MVVYNLSHSLPYSPLKNTNLSVAASRNPLGLITIAILWHPAWHTIWDSFRGFSWKHLWQAVAIFSDIFLASYRGVLSHIPSLALHDESSCASWSHSSQLTTPLGYCQKQHQNDDIGGIGPLCIFSLHGLHLALPTLHFALYTLHCTLYTPHSPL